VKRVLPVILVKLDLKDLLVLRVKVEFLENVVHLVYLEKMDSVDLPEVPDLLDLKDLTVLQDQEVSPANAVFVDATDDRDLPDLKSVRLRFWNSAARS
jgi:hypothetical protein